MPCLRCGGVKYVKDMTDPLTPLVKCPECAKPKKPRKRKSEIGLVQHFAGPAQIIVGPFATAEDAHEDANLRNRQEGRRMPPGHGSWGWMVADWGEIPRRADTVVERLGGK